MSVPITAGVGTSIATEGLASGDQQQIVLQGIRSATPLTEVAINVAGAGDNPIVAAVGGQKVRLYMFFLDVNAAVNVKWRDGLAGTDFHPVIHLLGQGAVWFMPFCTIPYFTTSVGNALELNLSGAVQVSGRAYYVQAA